MFCNFYIATQSDCLEKINDLLTLPVNNWLSVKKYANTKGYLLRLSDNFCSTDLCKDFQYTYPEQILTNIYIIL